MASGASKPPLNPMLGDPVKERFLDRESPGASERSLRLGSWTLAFIAMAAIAALVMVAWLFAR